MLMLFAKNSSLSWLWMLKWKIFRNFENDLYVCIWINADAVCQELESVVTALGAYMSNIQKNSNILISIYICIDEWMLVQYEDSWKFAASLFRKELVQI